MRGYSLSSHSRHGWTLVLSEFVATFGLFVCNLGLLATTLRSGAVRCRELYHRRYWFTASTSFANPAVTIARSLSDTFAGVRPSDVPLFIVAQIAGALRANLPVSLAGPELVGICRPGSCASFLCCLFNVRVAIFHSGSRRDLKKAPRCPSAVSTG
jgi:glycerol uptake facilitator-like aquaporin